jgi:hypothetical protein
MFRGLIRWLQGVAVAPLPLTGEGTSIGDTVTVDGVTGTAAVPLPLSLSAVLSAAQGVNAAFAEAIALNAATQADLAAFASIYAPNTSLDFSYSGAALTIL